MIYHFTLPEVAIVLGLLYIASHGAALLKPDTAKDWLVSAPRNYGLGVFLMAAAVIWFAWVLSEVPLMEYGPHRNKFIAIAVVGGALTAIYVREFLAVRAIGALLLLLAELMLESAFLRSDPARLLVTVTAYIYVVVGCFLVGSPYIMRDALEWVYAKPGRTTAAAAGGVFFGLVLLLLGLFVY